MKKKLCWALCFTLLIVFLCACDNGEKASRPVTSSSIQSVEDLLNAASTSLDDQLTLESDITTVEDAAQFLGIETTSDDTDDVSVTGEPDPDVDVDLTVMSATMVYSVVYDMVTKPSSYEGKTVKMDGIFDVYTDENTGKNYYACIIQDATKCCSSGIEFELKEERVYPDEYPDNGSYITVTGVFETYEEDGILYCTLRNAALNI